MASSQTQVAGNEDSASKISQTQNEPIQDSDYTLSRVPAEAKQPFWRILVIRIGSICCVSQLVLGASLGYGMSFWGAFWATMLGSVLLQVISWALGTAAAREGLSTSLLSRWTGFGKMGSAIFGGVMAISMVGWFGVQNSVFGEGMANILSFTDFLGKFETPAWSIVTGIAITVLVVFGVKAIANFATVFVPLFIVVVLYASFVMFQSNPLSSLFNTPAPGPALSLGAATTIVAGGFIAGAICTPDYGRFLRNGTEVFWMTLIGTFVGELGMNLLAVLLAHATGTNNVVDMMMATSGVIGVLIVVASTVKLNDINLYSSSLGLSTMINALFNRKLNPAGKRGEVEPGGACRVDYRIRSGRGHQHLLDWHPRPELADCFRHPLLGHRGRLCQGQGRRDRGVRPHQAGPVGGRSNAEDYVGAV